MITICEEPCWRLVKLDGRDFGDDYEGPAHYGTEAAARTAASHDETDEPLAPRQWPTPCVILDCDACGNDPEGDPFAHVHFPDEDTARFMASAYDFHLNPGSPVVVHCDPCRYGQPCQVRAARRPWAAPWPTYTPVNVTPDELQAAGSLDASVAEGWAEPATDPTTINYRPRQAAALVPFTVVDGRPRNPDGRTGRTGRRLGRWSENAAADPIVIADTIIGRRVLLVRRVDCGRWAIPGGMVEPGETAPAALVRELHEETGVDLTEVTPEVLGRTYVKDPRNTDEAWVVSTVALFRVPVPADTIAGSDAMEARWWPFDSLDQLNVLMRCDGEELYSAHVPLLTTAHIRLTQASLR